nr:porin family protein [uncultured Sphingomonas sp.]
MKTPLGLFAAAILAAAASTPAAAADFTGPRAEVTVGLDRLDFDLSALGTSDSAHPKGVTLGGSIGYDAPLGGGLVAGVEAGVTWSTAKRTFTNGTDTASLDAGRDFDFSARLGAQVGPRTLLYGKAGYTNLRLSADSNIAGVSLSSATNLDGYRLGLGVEQGLSSNTYLKGEYRYSNYEQDVSKNEVLAGVGLRF